MRRRNLNAETEPSSPPPDFRAPEVKAVALALLRKIDEGQCPFCRTKVGSGLLRHVRYCAEKA